MRGAAVLAGPVHRDGRGVGPRTALHGAGQEPERESPGEGPPSIQVCSPAVGSGTIGCADERDSTPAARRSEQAITGGEDVVDGGQQEMDHRLLMRRYCTTAMGAKTAMMATQHKDA